MVRWYSVLVLSIAIPRPGDAVQASDVVSRHEIKQGDQGPMADRSASALGILWLPRFFHSERAP
jgi:hypothetical protein